MATVTLNFSDADAGTVLAGAATDGFISALKLIQLGLAYENPDYRMGLNRFVAGRIAFRGTLDYKPIYSINPYFSSFKVGFTLTSNFLPYKGALLLESVPTSSQWTISISDVAVFAHSMSTPVRPALAPPMRLLADARTPVPVGR
jgi:hypothetical protein